MNCISLYFQMFLLSHIKQSPATFVHLLDFFRSWWRISHYKNYTDQPKRALCIICFSSMCHMQERHQWYDSRKVLDTAFKMTLFGPALGTPSHLRHCIFVTDGGLDSDFNSFIYCCLLRDHTKYLHTSTKKETLESGWNSDPISTTLRLNNCWSMWNRKDSFTERRLNLESIIQLSTSH